MKVLEKITDSCFYFLLVGLRLLNGMLDIIDEPWLGTATLSIERYKESLDLPEFYSLAKNAFTSTKSSVAEFSFSGYSSLIWEVDYLIKTFLYLQEKPFTNNTLSLNASANLFLIEKTQEHNLLKEFIQIKIYCHCGKCEKEKKKANSYQCNFFTESENKATEVKDLQKNFRTNLTELILGKVLIVSIEEVECDFPKGKSHATVLVISREEYSFRAFYCDSNGFNMPPVLRMFLEETFTEMINEGYIKKYYLDYSSKKQQKISSGCAIFSIINSAYISDRILKKASFREIRKALYYQPSECYFKEKTQEFFNFFDKRFCCYLVEKIDTLIDSLDIFLEKVYSTALSTDRINIKYNREKLKKLVIILKSLLEAEKNFNGIERKDFFSREFSVCNHKNKQQCFYKEGCFFWANHRGRLLVSISTSFAMMSSAQKTERILANILAKKE